MWRYARFRRSGATRGWRFDSYVPSASMIRRSPFSAVPSPRRNPLALPKDLLQEEFTGAIRRPHERSCGDVGEAHRFTGHAELLEHLRGHVFLDGEVPVARAKVLAHGHDVHPVRAEISHRRDYLGTRLVEVEHAMGVAGRHGAETAASRTRVAHQHDRRGAAAPALPDVWAMGLLAHCVKVQRPEQALQVGVVLARGWADPEPLRFALREHCAIAKVDLV